MSDFPKSVSLIEVGPREGFQFEKGPIATADKVRLVDSLSRTGLQTIQVCSFVSPKWVPQWADADEVTAWFRAEPSVTYTSVFLNVRGLERALAAQRYAVEGHLSLIASETFSRKNTNRGIAETLAGFDAWIDAYQQHHIPVSGITIMAAFGCNFEGDVPRQRVLDLIQQALDIAGARGERPKKLLLADTMGWAAPLQIAQMIDAVRSRWPSLHIALHLHDTRGTGMANVYQALALGIDELESATGGLGGCPFAGHKDAAGNVVTEDIVFMCEELGIDTGVRLDDLITCGRMAEEIVGHPLPGKVMKGGSLSQARRSQSA